MPMRRLFFYLLICLLSCRAESKIDAELSAFKKEMNATIEAKLDASNSAGRDIITTESFLAKALGISIIISVVTIGLYLVLHRIYIFRWAADKLKGKKCLKPSQYSPQ